MIQQLFRFGLIGVTALTVHWLVVVLLVPLGIEPLIANVFAFMVAFQVSYYGHRIWTFGASSQKHRKTLPRFITVSCSGFLLNEALYFLLLKYSSLDYRLSLFIVLALVAGLTFILSRQWAFKTA